MTLHVPTPGSTFTVPDPSNIQPEKGFDFLESIPPGVWAIIGGLLLILVVRAVFKALPWQLIGPLLIVVLFFVAFGDKFK